MVRSGITPVVAIVLLLMMTVATAGAAYTWVTGTITGGQEDTSQALSTELDIKDVQCSGGEVEVAIKNEGSRAFSTDQMRTYLYRDDTLAGNATVDITGASFQEPNGLSQIAFNITGAMLGGRTHTLEIDIGGYTVQGQCEAGGAYSCAALEAAGAASTSGEYVVDPDGIDGSGPFTAYCEMNPSYSGSFVADTYTFYYVEDGAQTARHDDPNDCKDRGMMLFSPRSENEYAVGRDYLRDTYGKDPSTWQGKNDGSAPYGGLGPLGIYIDRGGDTPSEWGNLLASADAHSLNQGDGVDSWDVNVSEATSLAGDDWFAADDVDNGEPNGDYTQGAWLGWNWDGNGDVNDYNDNNAAYGYGSYLCVHSTYLS